MTGGDELGTRPRPVIALVSRHIAPAVGGGIAVYVAALARVLATVAEVTILTGASQRAALEALDAPPWGAARVAYAPEPADDGRGGFYGDDHRWSAAVLERLAELYPGGGPDLVEFPDYRGEGAVTVQAVRTLDPRVRRTRVVVRLHTSAELTSVLNGAVSEDFGAAAVFALERYALANADRVLWAGGDIRGTYERYYGAGALAPATRVRHPVPELPDAPAPPPEPEPDGRLRLLYVGRLERRKGVAELIDAVTGLAREDWTLTLAGGDTETGALGASLREQLTLSIAGDERIRLAGEVGPEQLRRLLGAHDAVVAPSLWECWPYVGLEALGANRPLIATPVGGLVEQVGAAPGETGPGGRLAADCTPRALRAALTAALEAPDSLRELVAAGSPWDRARELADAEAIAADYTALAAAPRRWEPLPGAGPEPPLVSVVVPYFRLGRFVEAAVRSALESDYAPLEVIVVDDGSPEPLPSGVLALADAGRLRVVRQANAGLSAARNAGVVFADGTYVLPLDADNEIAPDFIARAVAVLEADPGVAYVTAWLAAIDEDGVPHGEQLGERPLGNSLDLIRRWSVGGDAVAVLRRSLFEEGFSYDPFLTSFEDWMLYRDLHAAGRHGHVIPEPLVRYRIRADSMVREIGRPFLARLQEEMHAHELAGRVRWTS